MNIRRATAGRVVGFADFGACRDEDVSPGAVGEVFSLYVCPGSWGWGVGTALMREALDRLRGEGFAAAVLWVIETNWKARRFYQGLGLVEDGAVRSLELYGALTPLVRLRRGLGVVVGPGL